VLRDSATCRRIAAHHLDVDSAGRMGRRTGERPTAGRTARQAGSGTSAREMRHTCPVAASGPTDIEIVRDHVSIEHIEGMALGGFGDLVKAVVDVRTGTMAIGGELHADEELVAIVLGCAAASHALSGRRRGEP
jgi:hypothetical protein